MADTRRILPVNRTFIQASILIIAALAAVLLSGLTAILVRAAAPAEGTVVEGKSVPGIALGASRSDVQAIYGTPDYCQDMEVGGDQAICRFPVDDGGGVTVWYHGKDGRFAANSPSDVAYRVQWSQAVSGWTTTAGVNTALALNDRQAVADAYPNAEVTYDNNGVITRVEDPELGIQIRWTWDGYLGHWNVGMATYTPPPVLAEGSSIHVDFIDLSMDKIKGRRHMIAVVSVRDEAGQAVSGADVAITWLYPRRSGATQSYTDLTSTTGYAFFQIYDAIQGNWTFTVDDVALEGHPFDRQNSQLSTSIKVR